MLQHEFSWSYSRYNLFNRCKLAYFFQYYASWGGWNHYADERCREIYQLKNLKKLDSWIQNIFRESLLESIQDGKYELNKLQRKVFVKLNSDLCELRHSSWREDPKKINLYETYYENKDINELESGARGKVSNIFANLAEMDPGVFNIPYLNMKHFKRPSSFMFDMIKVWSSPDIIFEEAGKIILVNIFFKDPASSSDWAFKSAVDAIFAESKWNGRSVESKNVFLHDRKYPQIYISRNIKEVKAIINSSCIEMLSLTKLDTQINEENFIPTENKVFCESCIYKGICRLSQIY